jgi:hypothetical protein
MQKKVNERRRIANEQSNETWLGVDQSKKQERLGCDFFDCFGSPVAEDARHKDDAALHLHIINLEEKEKQMKIREGRRKGRKDKKRKANKKRMVLHVHGQREDHVVVRNVRKLLVD